MAGRAQTLFSSPPAIAQLQLISLPPFLTQHHRYCRVIGFQGRVELGVVVLGELLGKTRDRSPT